MTTITMQVPDEVFSALRRSPTEFARDLRIAAAAHWYAQGLISQEKAALLAGLDRTDFLLALAREGVDVFVVDFDALRDELERGFDSAASSSTRRDGGRIGPHLTRSGSATATPRPSGRRRSPA